ncbi:hypothetical protein EDD16DRAFT_1537581 [Pisolithus croceorrhizus]|nr:hypothetical protein EDD16DRAFT_1537581 [Pisolithus croceorrhizus]
MGHQSWTHVLLILLQTVGISHVYIYAVKRDAAAHLLSFFPDTPLTIDTCPLASSPTPRRRAQTCMPPPCA